MDKKAKKVEELDLAAQEGGALPSEEINLVKLSEVNFVVKRKEKFKKSKQRKIVLENEEFIKEQKGKFDEAEQSVAKQGSRKKKLTNIFFFVLNLVILAGILTWNILTEGFVPLGDLPLHGWAIFVLIILFIGELFSEVLSMSYLLKKSIGKWRFGLCFKVHTIGRYYDSITPLGTGGQPFQITYFKKHDVPMHTSLAVPFAKYIFSQIVWTVISFVCMIVFFTSSPSASNGIAVVSAIGFILGSLLLFLVAFLSISKSLGRKLVVKILKLLQKMRIVKNYEKQYAKISKYIEDFQSVVKQYMTSFKDFVILFGLNLLKFIFKFAMPYFIVCLFAGPQSGEFINYFVMGIMVELASGCFPLPGGSGMNEISFKVMFTAAFASVGGGAVVWALLLWRLLTYYSFLLIGGAVSIYDFSFGNRKYKWQKRKEQLEEESRIFKQEQINKFRNERNKRRRAQSQRL